MLTFAVVGYVVIVALALMRHHIGVVLWDRKCIDCWSQRRGDTSDPITHCRCDESVTMFMYVVFCAGEFLLLFCVLFYVVHLVRGLWA